MPRHILHLFSDQQRFDTIAALGNPWIKTPNLDRLVREGVAFTRAYSPSPVCVPARAAMITGCYPGRTGCFDNDTPMPSQEAFPSYMSRLTEAGYRTHGIGKCHFSPDSAALRGFSSRESQEELPRRLEDDAYSGWLKTQGLDWIVEPHGVRSEMYYLPQPSPVPEAHHPAAWIGDRSVDFIRQQAGETAPWYLYSSFIHPHPPFAPPIPWHKLYRGQEMPLPLIPERVDELICHINRVQNRGKYRDQGFDLHLVRTIRAYYYACISFVDHQVGRILAALEETGQLDSTMVVFSSDHGEYLGDYGCFGKRGMHDVSARVPMVVRWPDGFGAGTQCETPASLVDLAPTFLEEAGISLTEGEGDGVSLRKIATGKTRRERVYAQFQRGAQALYMGVSQSWKYIYSAPDQQEYLFDLDVDPHEQCNLALREWEHPRLAILRHDCQQWAFRNGQGEEVGADGRWVAYPLAPVPTGPLYRQDPPCWDGRLPL